MRTEGLFVRGIIPSRSTYRYGPLFGIQEVICSDQEEAMGFLTVALFICSEPL
jgi:hypothetical protein